MTFEDEGHSMSQLRDISKYAKAAMLAGRLSDYTTLVSILEELFEEHGSYGLGMAIIWWIDTTLDTVVPEGPSDDGAFFRPAVQIVTDGEVDGPAELDEVPPEVAWSARVIAARASWDRDNYEALIRSVPEERTPEHLITLLMCCVETQRQLEKNPDKIIFKITMDD
jgi:hypothetical protein